MARVAFPAFTEIHHNWAKGFRPFCLEASHEAKARNVHSNCMDALSQNCYSCLAVTVGSKLPR